MTTIERKEEEVKCVVRIAKYEADAGCVIKMRRGRIFFGKR